jgi:hypothetical protein
LEFNSAESLGCFTCKLVAAGTTSGSEARGKENRLSPPARGGRFAYVFAHEAEAVSAATLMTIYWLHLSRLSDFRKLLQHHNIREGDV